jgi:hypothetical protein
MSTVILIFGIANLLLALYAIFKVRLSDNFQVSFIWWWAFLNGSFVWEDMIVFGLLHGTFSLGSFFLGNNLIWIVFFLVFWIVRSAGETLYFFLEQFVVPQHHPHVITEHFTLLRKIFGDISDQKCFIIMQVVQQSILISATVALIFVLISN